MADHVMTEARYPSRTLAWTILGAWIVCAAATSAWGSSLPDPTRPSIATTPSAPEGGTAGKPAASAGTGTAGAGTTGAGTTGAAASTDSTEASSGLSSVILRKGAKPAAIIDGQYVELGGKVGERKVVSITEGEVILKSTVEKEVLRLTPGIEKRPIVNKIAKKKAARKAAKGAKR